MRSERECRRAEAPQLARYSVPCQGAGQAAQRWPDAVLEIPGAPAHAFEIEFAVKGTRRLRQILTGYRDTPRSGAVTWLVDTPAVAARLARLTAALGAQDRISVHAWIRLDAAGRACIERAVAQATRRQDF